MSMLAMVPKMFNPGIETAQHRAMLAMSPGTAAAPAGAAAPAAAPEGASAGADQAAAGAEGVAPPQPTKIIIGSVLRGAVSGASMMFGINSFGPKIPFINKFMTSIITKIPFLAKAGFPMGTVAALGVGAGLGAVFGLIGGIRKARKATAEYVAAQAAAQAQQPAAQPEPAPVGDPLVLGPDGKPVGVEPATNIPHGTRKNPVMDAAYKAKKLKAAKAKRAAKAKAAANARGIRYHIVWGDTLWALSRRYGVSINDIVRANSHKIHNPNLIYAGDTITIPVKAKKRRS